MITVTPMISVEETLSGKVRDLARDVWRFNRESTRREPARTVLLKRMRDLRRGVPAHAGSPLAQWIDNLEAQVRQA